MLAMPSRTRTSSSATTTRFPDISAESLRPAVTEPATETTDRATESLLRLAGEQAALRRVAALLAEGVATEELLAVAAEEIARALEVPSARIARYDPDAVVVLGEFSDHGFPAGSV